VVETKLLVDVPAPLRARERDLGRHEITGADEERRHGVVVVDPGLEIADEIQLQRLEHIARVPRGIVHLHAVALAEGFGHVDGDRLPAPALAVARHRVAVSVELGPPVLPDRLERRFDRRAGRRGEGEREAHCEDGGAAAERAGAGRHGAR